MEQAFLYCDTLCLCCDQPQLEYANFSQYHGLCQDHQDCSACVLQCIHCNTFVSLLQQPDQPPKHCRLCRNALPKRTRDEYCTECTNLLVSAPLFATTAPCDGCDIVDEVRMYPCEHGLCHSCLWEIVKYTGSLDPSACTLCAQKQLATTDGSFNQCPKCQSAQLKPVKKRTLKCLECKFKYCKYCGKSDPVFSKCPNRHLGYTMVSGQHCPKCSGKHCRRYKASILKCTTCAYKFCQKCGSKDGFFGHLCDPLDHAYSATVQIRQYVEKTRCIISCFNCGATTGSNTPPLFCSNCRADLREWRRQFFK